MFSLTLLSGARGVASFAVLALLGLGACQTDELAAPSDELDVVVTDPDEDGHTDLQDYGNPGEVLDHLDELGLDLDVYENVRVPYPDGSVREMVKVGGDIMMTPAEFAEAAATPEGELTSRQYRTRNLVNPNTISTIRVVGYNGGRYALTSREQTALRWAVDNYNALNLRIRFTLRFAASEDGDMVVYRNPDESGTGGSAGFPANGRPNKYVQIYGISNLSTNTIEHVITHEMGHSVGFRHTDYATRRSCNQSGEGAGTDGAIQIPGTPSGYDANSIMLACFGDEDGEFGYYDRVALQYLY